MDFRRSRLRRATNRFARRGTFSLRRRNGGSSTRTTLIRSYRSSRRSPRRTCSVRSLLVATRTTREVLDRNLQIHNDMTRSWWEFWGNTMTEPVDQGWIRKKGQPVCRQTPLLSICYRAFYVSEGRNVTCCFRRFFDDARKSLIFQPKGATGAALNNIFCVAVGMQVNFILVTVATNRALHVLLLKQYSHN